MDNDKASPKVDVQPEIRNQYIIVVLLVTGYNILIIDLRYVFDSSTNFSTLDVAEEDQTGGKCA